MSIHIYIKSIDIHYMTMYSTVRILLVSNYADFTIIIVFVITIQGSKDLLQRFVRNHEDIVGVKLCRFYYYHCYCYYYTRIQRFLGTVRILLVSNYADFTIISYCYYHTRIHRFVRDCEDILGV